MDGRDGLCGQAAPKRWEGLHSELSYKRLEGSKFYWPKIEDGVMRLSPAQLSALLEGMQEYPC
jgi:transposase